MPKTKKIDVLTVKLTVHIPLDRADATAVLDAYKRADGLLAFCSNVGKATMDWRLNRVPAPEPKAEASEPEPEALEPAADNLDGPSFLDRTDPKMAAAE